MSIIEIAQKTRLCARKLAVLSADAKNQAIEAMAKALEAAAPDIVVANAADCKAAQADGMAKPLYDRLKLDRLKLKSAIAGLRDVAIQKIGWKNTTKAQKAFGDVPAVTTETRFVR
jgi:glutamate-5-semialdehyde dehydrogenase